MDTHFSKDTVFLLTCLHTYSISTVFKDNKRQVMDVGNSRIEAVVVIAPLGPLSRQGNVSLAFAGKMDKFPSNS